MKKYPLICCLYFIILLLLLFAIYNANFYIYLPFDCFNNQFLARVINYDNCQLLIQIKASYYIINDVCDLEINDQKIQIYEQCVLLIKNIDYYDVHNYKMILMNLIIGKLLMYIMSGVMILMIVGNIFYCLILLCQRLGREKEEKKWSDDYDLEDETEKESLNKNYKKVPSYHLFDEL